MSTATIYAHRFDQANTELEGIIGGEEKGSQTIGVIVSKLLRIGKKKYKTPMCLRLKVTYAQLW